MVTTRSVFSRASVHSSLRVALRRVRVVEEQALDLTLERRLQRSHVGAGAGQDQRVLRIADALGSGLRGRLKRASSIAPAFGEDVISAPPFAPQQPEAS